MNRDAKPVRLAALTVLVALAAGCEVRDERAAAPRSGWSLVPVVDSRPLLQGNSATPTTIEYVEGYESGLRRAAEDGRPLLLVFRGSWCRWSAELAQETLTDPRIVGLSRRFVCVAIDADRDATTCRHFGVDRFPTVLLLDAGGGERFRVTGSAADGLADAMAGLLGATADRRRMARRPTAPAR